MKALRISASIALTCLLVFGVYLTASAQGRARRVVLGNPNGGYPRVGRGNSVPRVILPGSVVIFGGHDNGVRDHGLGIGRGRGQGRGRGF